MLTLSPALRLLVTASWIPDEGAREVQFRELGSLICDFRDWGGLLSLVDRHRVPALIHTVLRQEGLPSLPDDVRESLQQRDRVSRLQAMQHTGKTVGLLRMLAELHVEAIPLKGVFLSQRLYGDIGVRQSKDIDLLVKPEDFNTADTLLGKLGYRRPALVAGHTPTPRQEACLRRTHYHYEYDHPDGTQVELHWRRQSCSPSQMDLLWKHTRVDTWMGMQVRSLDDDMLLLFLCDHGAHHRWFRIKWLSDVAMLLSQRNDSGCPGLLQLASQLDVERPLAQAALLSHWLYGIPLAEPLRQMALQDSAVKTLALDALDAITGSESDGLMRTTIPKKLRFQMRLRKRPDLAEFTNRLALSPYDFAMLPLPDSLFPLYYPLRPLLWLLRRFTRKTPAPA